MEEHIHCYTAGLIDGEGSIMLLQKHSYKYRTPSISVTSTTYELLEFLKEHYGGCIVRQKKYQAHHKQAWVWHVFYDNAISFCEHVLPYLREPVKRYRASLLVNEYRDVTPRNGKYTDEIKTRKLDFEARFLAS